MNKKHIYFYIILLIFVIFLFTLIPHNELFVDENPHYEQIINFIQGDFNLNPDLTTIPGFHIIYYVLSSIFGISSIIFFRIISFLISILTIYIFYLLLVEIKSTDKNNKIIQFIFMPILFMFFFLIYTDVMSLLFVLTSLLFAFKNKINLSSFFGLLSILIRQNNIMWLLFIFIFVLLRNEFSFLEKRKSFKQKVITLIEFIKLNYLKLFKKYFLFILTGILFIIFVIINQGVALGDKEAHPTFSLHTGNIFFMLFLFFIIFLPTIIQHLNYFFKDFKNNYFKFISIGLLIFIIYILTFINNHPYNIDWGDYFIRNRILIYFTSTLFLKTIFFIPILISIYSLSKMKFYFNKYLIFLISIIYLLPSWLIEQRYYIIPFTMYLLFIKKEKSKFNIIQSIYSFILTLLIFYLIIKENMFF